MTTLTESLLNKSVLSPRSELGASLTAPIASRSAVPNLSCWIPVALALLLAPVLGAAAPTPMSAPAVWQYSVPLEAGTERRAYLWIPPDCRRTVSEIHRYCYLNGETWVRFLVCIELAPWSGSR